MTFVNFYESVTDGPTDGPTDRRTDGRKDKPTYRDARTHLKSVHVFLFTRLLALLHRFLFYSTKIASRAKEKRFEDSKILTWSSLGLESARELRMRIELDLNNILKEHFKEHFKNKLSVFQSYFLILLSYKKLIAIAFYFRI